MLRLVLAAILFLIGLAALGGSFFGREQKHRLIFLTVCLVLWAGAVGSLLFLPATIPTPIALVPT